jgi:hypothetical protein
MNALVNLPELIYSRNSHLLTCVILLDSQAQQIACAGELSGQKNLLIVGGAAIYALSTIEEELNGHQGQLWLNHQESTIILLKIQKFYLLFFAHSCLVGQLQLLVDSLARLISRGSIAPKILPKEKEKVMLSPVPSSASPESKSDHLFLTRCERELSQLIDNRVAKFLIKKHYFLVSQSRTKFLQILAQKIKDPVAKKSFFDTLIQFC